MKNCEKIFFFCTKKGLNRKFDLFKKKRIMFANNLVRNNYDYTVISVNKCMYKGLSSLNLTHSLHLKSRQKYLDIGYRSGISALGTSTSQIQIQTSLSRSLTEY